MTYFYARNSKIFKMMADFVATRDGIQCRSHHIKQLRTHRQIRRIIELHSASNSIMRPEVEDSPAATPA